MRKFLLTTILIFFVSVLPVFASGYDTNFYGTTVNVAEDNSYDIEEVIRVNFEEPRHGIFRFIPTKGVRLTNIDVPGRPFTTYKEGDNEVIQIGSADKVITGEYSYLINYKISMWADENNEKDMFLINVLPTDWETSIDEFVCVVEMPKKTDLSSLKVYSGPYGSETNECNVKVNTDGNSIALTAKNVPEHNGVTLSVELPDGYWNAPVYGAATNRLYLGIIAPLLAFFAWIKRKKHVVVTPEFYPPNDMTPGEIGFYCDETADDKDLFASIVYLANKGYMNIKEDSSGLLFEQLEAPDASEPRYVKSLYDGIFKRTKKLRIGQNLTVSSKQLGALFSKQFETARFQLANMFSGDKEINDGDALLTKSLLSFLPLIPSLFIFLWACSYEGSNYMIFVFAFIAAILSMMLCNKCQTINSKKWFYIPAVLVIPFAACLIYSASNLLNKNNFYIIVFWAVATLVSVLLMQSINVKKDIRLYGQILGFKDFIKTAELDKLNELIEEDPAYFYNIIPYAYVFGLTDKWIKKFESIEIKVPELRPNVDFNTTKRVMTNYSHNMNRGLTRAHEAEEAANAKLRRTIDTNYKDISSYTRTYSHSSDSHSYSSSHSDWSSGGGFSGGGHSGGGSGGGGGGGW